ncbi:MAG: hypothetical protein FJX74_01135 [Armatimonadetes bacterium]|nr:hypothetical protein [Armatimonadota bacterium]
MVMLLILAPMAVGHVQEAHVKRSDVVFMGPKSGDIYDAYGATMVSWGGGAWSEDPKAVEQFGRRVQDAHDRGMRYCAGLAFRTAFAKMIDFDEERFMESVCRTLDGEPITVPWLWDHAHKGHPAYWFCTNAPGYRAYLKHQADLATLTDIEGLHIDDYNGTAGTEWRGGCFCPHCMAAFREYLKANVPAEELAELGITSPDGFDYGEWLRARGTTVDEYRKTVDWKLPLGPEFVTFQYRAAAEWVGEVRRYAEERIGHPLMLSVNSSANGPKALVIASKLTYFCGEVDHRAESLQVPDAPVFVFKLGEALGKPQVCTASGQDWAYVMAEGKPGLVRTWIAQSYAFGHQLMAPHRQWAYTQEKGTHWYESKPEDYADLYRFVRGHAELLDDYEPLAEVGVVYSNAAFRANKNQARDACYALAHANVPFRLLIAGDDWLDDRLAADDLTGLKAIVIADPLPLDAEQQTVLDAAADRLVTWPDEARLRQLAPASVSVGGAEGIMALPRAVPGDDARPVVVHLLNLNYSGDLDGVARQANVTLTLGKSLLGRAVSKATLFAPGAEPLDLPIAGAADRLRVSLPELGLWGIVALQ